MTDKIRHINQQGLDLIKKFEELRLEAYLCPAGVWTIGWGHTSQAGKPHVHKGMTITKEEAKQILNQDLDLFEQATHRILDDANKYINENQFSALVSFGFNTGLGALKDSTLMRLIHAKDLKGASKQFSRWVYGGGKRLRGLERRRRFEKALFNKKVE